MEGAPRPSTGGTPSVSGVGTAEAAPGVSGARAPGAAAGVGGPNTPKISGPNTPKAGEGVSGVASGGEGVGPAVGDATMPWAGGRGRRADPPREGTDPATSVTGTGVADVSGRPRRGSGADRQTDVPVASAGSSSGSGSTAGHSRSVTDPPEAPRSVPGRNRAVLRLVSSDPDISPSQVSGRESDGERRPARSPGSGRDGDRHPAWSGGDGPDGTRYPERWGAAGGDGPSGRGGEVGRRRADGAYGDGLWPGAGLPAGTGQRPAPVRGPWPELGPDGTTDVRTGGGRDASDPWPALPDDRALWAVPEPEDAAAAHLRRLDREQAGG